MAELATIARPYAEALFKAGGGAAEAEQVNALAAVAADAQLRQFADNPKVSAQQVLGVMGGAIKARCSTTAAWLRCRRSRSSSRPWSMPAPACPTR
jgi:F-type H+-transporting ATPase subunit delta